jgi:hypothetical protein
MHPTVKAARIAGTIYRSIVVTGPLVLLTCRTNLSCVNRLPLGRKHNRSHRSCRIVGCNPTLYLGSLAVHDAPYKPLEYGKTNERKPNN